MLSLALSVLLNSQHAHADPRDGVRAGLCMGLDPSCAYSALQLEAADPSMALGVSLGPDQFGVNGRMYLFPRSTMVRPHLSFGASITTDEDDSMTRTGTYGQTNSLLIEPDLIVAPGMGVDFHFGPGNHFILRPHVAMGMVSMNDTVYDYVGGSLSLMVHFNSEPTQRRRRRIRRRR